LFYAVSSELQGGKSIAAKGFGLAEVGELEVQMFSFVQMLIRIPMFKFSTIAPLLPNPC
jgi:hypothetical protein